MFYINQYILDCQHLKYPNSSSFILIAHFYCDASSFLRSKVHYKVLRNFSKLGTLTPLNNFFLWHYWLQLQERPFFSFNFSIFKTKSIITVDSMFHFILVSKIQQPLSSTLVCTEIDPNEPRH